jgi:hypothetical protein
MGTSKNCFIRPSTDIGRMDSYNGAYNKASLKSGFNSLRGIRHICEKMSFVVKSVEP